MKFAFLLSAVIEICGGLIMYLKPSLMFDTDFIVYAKLYATAAVVLGFVNMFAFLHYEKNVFFKKLFLSMFGFHGALSFICFGMPVSSMNMRLEATLLHLACFVVFFITYMKNIEPVKKS